MILQKIINLTKYKNNENNNTTVKIVNNNINDNKPKPMLLKTFSCCYGRLACKILNQYSISIP